MKATQLPDLAAAKEYAFGECDISRGGGGLNPSSTTGTVYRAIDSATSIKEARQIVLSLAPPSLSSCYNYTQNYRKGSIQSKRHHSGPGVNMSLVDHLALVWSSWL